jgi:acyl-CoA thioester hydrolase
MTRHPLPMTSARKSEFRLRRRVQFYEADPAGIVHFSWFFRYMEEAEHALWRDVGLSIAPEGASIGWPRVAASFEYHRPLLFEQEFDVTIRVLRVSSRTIEYSCEITRDGSKIATGALRIACVSRRPGEPIKSVDIPADIAARFQ